MDKFRVEVYEGCSLRVSLFDSRDDADEYRNSAPADDTRIVTVNENGAAVTRNPTR